MLGIEGNGEGIVHLIVTSEVPRWCLMSTMFSLHEVPPVIGVGSKCPATQISLQRTSTIERGIGMCVIFAIIEETVDAAIDGCRQFLRNDVPLVVAFDIEEVTFIIGVGLRLIEMAVLTDLLLHVAMGIQTIVAL